MEPVRFGSDFKNQPRVGQRFIQSTAGAVSIKGGKGDLAPQKVSVKRYIAGKKPEWAPDQSSEEESEDEANEEREEPDEPEILHAHDIEDEQAEDIRHDHGRRVYEPRILTQHDDEDKQDAMEMESSEEEEDFDEEAAARRRRMLRAKARFTTAQDKDLLDFEEEEDVQEEEDESESSEYEEDSSDSDEDAGQRLKPVFVRKKDRVTIQERERIEEETNMTEEKHKKILDDRKKLSTRLVRDIVSEELKEEQGVEKVEELVITDDDNDEEEYEAWKVRELKRIKRDKDERENREKERVEIERMHNMTEDERRNELRSNPKEVTNKSSKGKYKFLQKYYHRGAFFLNEEDDMYKRDTSGATLEDQFDKTVLPKVMQVKNFGRSGRTKYTHLVDQDTTKADSPWFAESSQSIKFHAKIGGGQKQTFEKPSRKKK
ncbi:microfibrillar-associated protein 1-like isoform X1 [Clytia hemisphaerica]|uniref:Micro-fibrillar-associated protein 1 C-terminal domain-containing protein n=1 Tax=Clytia hemisphaerica TaxID=252671 RepID=A0A7M6DPB3_9CNID